jgi:hypothetical protein
MAALMLNIYFQYKASSVLIPTPFENDILLLGK